MLLIQNNNTDPYFNLALEEYLLKEFKNKDSGEAPEDCFMLWQNEPCVVVGKNQNILDEINEDFVKKNNIKIARRISGGGAVYHDLGNLNFTFIINDTQNDLRNYKKFLTPIIEALATLGVKAEMSERNDLLIDGLKFSGNAQYKHRNRLLHHGTILFSSDLNNVRAALKTDGSKGGKWVKSVSSSVTNVQNHLSKSLSIEELKTMINNYIASGKERSITYNLTLIDIDKVTKLIKEKYKTDNWIYANLLPVLSS